MTKLLERAIKKLKEATKLPNSEQDAIAAVVLSEIDSEREWDVRFKASADKLRRLAASAHEEFQSGRTEELDPERL